LKTNLLSSFQKNWHHSRYGIWHSKGKWIIIMEVVVFFLSLWIILALAALVDTYRERI